MPSTNIDELIAKCEGALQSRNFEEAITGCRTVLSLAPDNSRAKELLEDAQSKLEAELFVRENLRKAQDAFQSRDYQKCINECQKIQLLDPDNPSVAELLSKAQEKLEAEPFIQNFITSGQSLSDSGLFSEAIAQWEKVRSIDPAFPGLDKLIEAARAKMGAPAGAPAATAGTMFDFNSGSSMPELSLPAEEAEAPAAEQAEEYTFGFESDQDKIRKFLKDGDELAQSGEHQRAIEVWSEIFMLDVSNEEALQRIDSSRKVLSQQSSPATTMAPEDELGSLEDLVRKGNEAEAAGEYREAAQILSQALAIDADNADLADRIKNLNLLAKRQDQGKTVMGNARAFLAEGKVESARHAVSKILESDPENQEALDLMREIKGKNAGGTSSGEMRSIPSASVSKSSGSRSLPIIPIAIAAVMVLGGGVYAYFSMFKQDSSAQTQAPKIVKKTPAQQPVPSPNATPKPTGPVVTPQMRESAEKMAAEASFYLQEKHYEEAVAKADEALKLDPQNSSAQGVRAEADKRIKDAIAAERKVLTDANTYFELSEFAGAVRLYEKYLALHPETVTEIQPQVIKCYYNLGVIAIRQWRCDTAADYFRQVLFIDENDKLSKDALTLARKCQQVGTSDLEIRKQVTFLEMRK